MHTLARHTAAVRVRKPWCVFRVGAMAAVGIGLACWGEAGWIHLKAALAQELIARAWQRSQAGDRDTRPWPWADTRPIAKLSAAPEPRGLMVLDGASGRNLAFGPVHDPASVLPGETGNSVIEGHRDTHFRFLENLKLGDQLRIDRVHRPAEWFTVTDLRVVDSRRWRIELDADSARLTLVTCYPFHALKSGSPLRYVVTADLIGRANSARERRSRIEALAHLCDHSCPVDME
jgi:sortase A